MENDTNESRVSMPGYLKMIVGAAVGGVILWKAPIVEILALFFYIVMIPLALLSAIGLIGSGTMETLGGTFNNVMDSIRGRVQDKREAAYAEPRYRDEGQRRTRPTPQA